MQLLHEVIDGEHYLEIALTEKDLRNLWERELIQSPMKLVGKSFHIGIRTAQENEDAVEERY